MTKTKKTIRPDERKIKQYAREDRNFNPSAYRRAFYKTGELIAANRGIGKHEQSKTKNDR